MYWVPARMAAALKNQIRCPKRFIYHLKEKYISVKRDLYVNKKRPVWVPVRIATAYVALKRD